MSDIRKDFEDLVKKYVADLAAVEAGGVTGAAQTVELTSTLLDSLESTAADHWYSSSADC